MSPLLLGIIENVCTLIATVLVCWLTSSPWGLLCLININTFRHKKEEGKKETNHD